MLNFPGMGKKGQQCPFQSAHDDLLLSVMRWHTLLRHVGIYQGRLGVQYTI